MADKEDSTSAANPSEAEKAAALERVQTTSANSTNSAHDMANNSQPAKNTAGRRLQTFLKRIKPGEWAIIVLTAAIAGAAIASDLIFCSQLGTMRGQLDEMQTEQRPWIGAPKPFSTNFLRGLAPIVLTFENSGNNPTESFLLDAKVTSFNDGAWPNQARNFCQRAIKTFYKNPNDFAAFPKAPWSTSLVEMPSSCRGYTVADLRKVAAPAIVGCAVYRSNNKLYTTAFIGPLDLKSRSASGSHFYTLSAQSDYDPKNKGSNGLDACRSRPPPAFAP